MIKDIMTEYDISDYDMSIFIIFIIWYFVYLT